MCHCHCHCHCHCLARDKEHNDVLQGEADVSQPVDQEADDVEAQKRYLEHFWDLHLSSSR